MKILQICTMDDAGAGTAAFRLYLGLKSLGLDSKMLVLNRNSSDSDVVKIEERINSIFKKIANRIHSKSISLELAPYEHTRLKDADLFSNNRTLHKISKHPLVKEADIITLRWITFMVDYREFFHNINGKPIVWRLSDMNPFTGGCHYSDSCTRYQVGCGTCPQLGSKNTNDLSRRIFKRKKKAYKNHNLHIVTPSHWLGDCVQKSLLFKDFNVDVIPNGVPTDIFRKRNKVFSRDLLNLPQDKTLILFGAAYLTKRKGFNYLLETLKLLKKKIDTSGIALVTFGPEQEVTTFHKDTQIPVYQLGYIRIEKLLSQVYSSADMYAVPSTQDNSPNTVLESMACKTPVIGFNTGGGLENIVIPNKTGLLAELKHTKDLSNKIEYMITHPKEREEMGENARKLVEQEYTIQTQAKRYLKLYEMMFNR